MNQAFKRIFSGFLLEFFDINIGTFDIIPDFIGYILIFIGIGQLASIYSVSHLTRYGRLTSFILIVFSMIRIFVSAPTSNNQIDPFWTVFTFLSTIILTILIYYLFQIMLHIARIEEQVDYYNGTRNLAKIYIGTLLIQGFLQPFAWNFSNDDLGIIVIPLSILLILLYIGFLIQLHRFSKMTSRTEIMA